MRQPFSLHYGGVSRGLVGKLLDSNTLPDSSKAILHFPTQTNCKKRPAGARKMEQIKPKVAEEWK